MEPNRRGGISLVKNLLRRLLVLLRLGAVNIAKCLRIAVHQRKPAALELHHDPVSAAESVADVRHGPFHARDFVWLERFRAIIPISVLAAHRFSSNQLLIMAELNFGWI